MRQSGQRLKSLFLREEGQGSGVAMQKILFTYGPDLAIAEEPGHAQWAKMLLNHARIVIRFPE